MHSYDVSLPSRVDATTSGDVRYTLQVALDAVHDGELNVDASAVVTLDVAVRHPAAFSLSASIT